MKHDRHHAVVEHLPGVPPLRRPSGARDCWIVVYPIQTVVERLSHSLTKFEPIAGPSNDCEAGVAVHGSDQPRAILPPSELEHLDGVADGAPDAGGLAILRELQEVDVRRSGCAHCEQQQQQHRLHDAKCSTGNTLSRSSAATPLRDFPARAGGQGYMGYTGYKGYTGYIQSTGELFSAR